MTQAQDGAYNRDIHVGVSGGNMEGPEVLDKIKGMGKQEVQSVCSRLTSEYGERNRAMGIAAEQAVLTTEGRELLTTVQAVASATVRRAGVSDISFFMRFMAASLHLMAATISRAYVRPIEYRALVAAWVAVLPEVADVSGVGVKPKEVAVVARRKTEAEPQPQSREKDSPRQLREIKEGKVSGDPSQGVRIKPSVRDHPGLYFLIEAKANRRVYSGYYELEEAEQIIRKQGWTNLGMVGTRDREEKEDVSQVA